MRSLLASALVLLAACGSSDAGDDSSAHGAPSASAASGPDPIVLRVPRAGGSARAYVYPALDSVVWRSAASVPGMARVLAFDPDGGLVAFVDVKGRPVRLDLRVGAATASGGKAKLARLASADGSDIYGLDGAKVARLTPSGGAWPFQAPAGIREVVPQPDGGLVVVAARQDSTIVWRVRPPDTRLLDTAALPRTRVALGTQLGDRVYFVGESTLHALRSRDLQPAPSITFDGRIVDLAATPSGDRIYVSLADGNEVQIVDRYRDAVVGTIELPTPVDSLRMDALGRYLLARARGGDSAYVIALGTGRMTGAPRTAWRADLPFVAPDGAVALARGPDVVFVDAETLAPRRTVAGGASDFWHMVLWNGFRPRARGLDEPVVFAQRDTVDTLAAGEPIDTSAFAIPAGDSTLLPRTAEPAPRPALPATPPAPVAAETFTLSFAALRNESDARALASRLEIDGERARVVPSTVAGTPIYRVVMGPFRTKADAERRGKASGRDYWVYAGTP